jgi:hypothetical protein
MVDRMWLDADLDGNDWQRLEASFLRFWGAASHAEVRDILQSPQGVLR